MYKDSQEGGFAILLAKQNLPLALSVANSVYMINKGMGVFQGTPETLQNNEEVNREYLAPSFSFVTWDQISRKEEDHEEF